MLIRIVVDTDVVLAQRVLEIQRAAYAVEATLVGFDAIPGLHESLSEDEPLPGVRVVHLERVSARGRDASASAASTG